MSENKTALYICKGCDISTSIDIETLEKDFSSGENINICTSNDALCSAASISAIKKSINENSIQKIIIAACSPRKKTKEFDFGDNIHCTRVNLREHVSWCQEPEQETTQMMAEDYIRMGINSSFAAKLPVIYQSGNFSNSILIIGGGLSGISAAIAAAKSNYKVILIEKTDKLGGWYKDQSMHIPENPPFTDLIENHTEELIHIIKNNKNIEIYTNTLVDSINGQPGDFKVKVSQKESTIEFHIGSIITAAGSKPYDPQKLNDLGYGKYKNIITTAELENIFLSDNHNDNTPESITFLLCAGSRDQEHLPYCSSDCCLNSIRQALQIRRKYPQTLVYLIYKDIRTPGHYEHFYNLAQSDPGIFFTKAHFDSIENPDNFIKINLKDSLIGKDISLETEILVLANGMVPDTAENKILQLSYRQGSELPELKYGFPDSHFICFPYESRRTAIFVAGSQRQPMTPAEAVIDGEGAALKAIQALVQIKQGKTLHPRTGDRSWPEIYFPRCTSCKRCTEECPFGAYDEDEKGTPKPNPTRCRRCGICLGACPERVINFNDYSIEMITSMIKNISMPDEFEEMPRILVLMCENDAYPALDLAGEQKLKYSPYVRVIPVRCIGSVNAIFINEAFSKGFDGILLIGCKSGDDYQCHFIKGSEILNTRGENMQETLTTLSLEPERLQAIELSIDEYYKLPQIFDEFAETINTVGPNPFKDL